MPGPRLKDLRCGKRGLGVGGSLATGYPSLTVRPVHTPSNFPGNQRFSPRHHVACPVRAAHVNLRHIYLPEGPVRRRNKRLIMIGGGGAILALALVLILTALSQKITYFYGPSDLVALDTPPANHIRLGGLVEEGSVERGQGLHITFRVTDGAATVPVVFDGNLPDLFRERQGVIAEGTYIDGVFEAREILAKHDETYMPREVVEALQRSGEWRGPAPSDEMPSEEEGS